MSVAIWPSRWLVVLGIFCPIKNWERDTETPKSWIYLFVSLIFQIFHTFPNSVASFTHIYDS